MKNINIARVLMVFAILSWSLILSPYKQTTILAGSIACLTLPIYRWIRARHASSVSLTLYFIFLALCFIIPIATITILVTPQAVAGYKSIIEWGSNDFMLPLSIENFITESHTFLLRIPGYESVLKEILENFQNLLNIITKALISGGLDFAGTTINKLWQIILMIILAALGVVYAPTLRRITVRILNLPEESLNRFIISIYNALRSVFVGILFVAAMQGALLGIGLFIFDVPQAAFWALLASICAIIPVIGTAIIWLPLAIVTWLQGSIGNAIGVLLWGGIIVSCSDNLIRPYLLKTGINTSIIVLFLAIICGLAAFGIIGLILGPVLVAIAIQAMHESDYFASLDEEKEHETKQIVEEQTS